MKDLLAALTASLDPTTLVRRITEQICLLTPKADGAAVSLLDGNDAFVVVSAHGLVTSLLGLTLPRHGTLMDRAVTTGRSHVSAHTPSDESLLAEVRTIGARLGVQSLVVIPLLHRGDVIGALSMTAMSADTFAARDVAALEAIGRFVSVLVSSHTELSAVLDGFLDDPHLSSRDSAARFLASVMLPDIARDDELRRRVHEIATTPADLTAVFQPVVDLDTEAAVGWEGLSRFPQHPDRTPWQWFDTARRVGRGVQLELAALRRVLAEGAGLPAEQFLAVNLSPATAERPDVQAVLLATSRPLVVEITEHEPFPDTLADALAPLRKNGIRLAIDDAGAGYASFTQLLRLRPDIIKMDGSLTQGIDEDPVKRALTSAVVQLAQELHAVTVAESIEQPAQKLELRRLGVNLGQGYLFGRPSASIPA